MRKIAYFFLICTVVGLIISAVFQSFPLFTVIGRGLLLSLSTNQYEQAYGMFTSDFQNRNSFTNFKDKVHALGLDQYENVIWTNQLEDKQNLSATIKGTVFLKDKRQLEIQLEMIQVRGASATDKGWRIDNMYVK